PVNDSAPTQPTQAGPKRFAPPSIEELNGTIPGYELSLMFNLDDTGALYRARHTTLDRDVCIKILPPPPEVEHGGYLESFRTEAHTMAKLHHPNIIKVYDSGETTDGLPYFVMEYVEGSILRRMIDFGQISMEHVLGWIPPLCEALQYAHLQGIVHCDVRPSNILLTFDGEVKLANFRLSRVSAHGVPGFAASTVHAAPEMHEEGTVIDYRADIYSLGVVLYEMLTGRLPIGTFAPASTVAGVDPRFDDIIRGALQPDRDARWQTALDISTLVCQIRDYPASGTE
ncbi:MAG: serine/threonine-protein kinase, partial [Verrucomicrobiales bacterium]